MVYKVYKGALYFYPRIPPKPPIFLIETEENSHPTRYLRGFERK